MYKLWKKASTLLLINYAYMLEYRAELFLWALSGSMPFILMGVWMEAAKTGNLPFNQIEFARYFLSAFIVRQFTVVWVIWEFEKEVVEGKLSPRLLQPIDPVWHYVASHVSERFARLPFIGLLIMIFFLLYPQAFWLPNLSQFLLFIVISILIFTLRFTIQYTFAMLTFFTERATSIENFWLIFYLFLSGVIAPLEVFPEELRNILLWTPFPYLIHFPAAILMGQKVNIWSSLIIIFMWLGLFLIVNRVLWRLGIKKYSGMGA
jgi:ABC-2 type transport system permease protein